jgi:hypothetical protein
VSTSLTTPPEQQLVDDISLVIEAKTYGDIRQADRCDWCGAQAFVRVVHPTELAHDGIFNKDLLFCGHHFKRVEDDFADWTVYDERAKIN